ncbi:MAG: hypothetical protein ACFFDW_09830 [Candidatus Thorarchaeota archaeon]
MDNNKFKEYLLKSGADEQKASKWTDILSEYQKYLEQKGTTIEKVKPEKIVEYSEKLVEEKSENVLDFLRIIINYANFSKRNEFITAVIDIFESFNAMDNLFIRVGENYGEEIRNEIFKDLVIPPLGVHPEKKPNFTKKVFKRIETKLGEEESIKLLKPCLHGRPADDIEGDRKLLAELGIDQFLKRKHEELIKRFEKHRDEGTMEFAQKVDNEVVDFIKKDQAMAEGIREGNIIYVKKHPYQIKEYLHAKDNKMKRFYLCYCPWVRGAFKDGTDKEVTKHFCQCSGGWYKLYWDEIFEEPVRVEPVATALDGDLECKFAVYLPERFVPKEK